MVVVSGIVEVLLVIGLGFLVVIFVVIFYNKFLVDSDCIIVGYEVFMDEFVMILSC